MIPPPTPYVCCCCICNPALLQMSISLTKLVNDTIRDEMRILLNGACVPGTVSPKARYAVCGCNVDLRPPEENQLGP